MKKTFIVLSFAITLLMAYAAVPGPSSSGAPASHTGAPGEKTCGAVGCHDDNVINEGTASVSIEVGDGIKKYEAGQTYPIKIRITDADKLRFGFQITALNAQTQTNVGNFTITDTKRTQIVKNAYQLKERQYATYTFNGTDAVTKGIGEWFVNWTAPKNSTEPVTFYVGAVSANDDMSDKGDKVYTSSLTLNK